MRSFRAALFGLLLPVQATACDIALAFAVDASGSVTSEDFAIQLQGVADGLRDPMIADAIVNGQAALALVQWSGRNDQRTSINWTSIGTPTDLSHFAAQVEAVPRAWSGSNTAIGALLAYAHGVFSNAPPCARFVLDVSGNGPSNEGHGPSGLREGLWESGITVNAIVIDPTQNIVREYFENNVIIGPGSFVIDVPNRDAFSEGMKEKLRREISLQFVAIE